MDVEFEIEDEPDPRTVSELEDLLNEFNFATTGIRDGKELAIFERDSHGRMVAGLYGWTWGGTCEIDMLWLDESQRRGGKGSAMLEAAEAEARARLHPGRARQPRLPSARLLPEARLRARRHGRGLSPRQQ